MLEKVIIRGPGKAVFVAHILRLDFRLGQAFGIRNPHARKQDRRNPDRCAEPGSDVPDIFGPDPPDEPNGFHEREKDRQQEAGQEAGSREKPKRFRLFPEPRRIVRTMDYRQGKKAHIAHQLRQHGQGAKQIEPVPLIPIGIVPGNVGFCKEACHKGKNRKDGKCAQNRHKTAIGFLFQKLRRGDHIQGQIHNNHQATGQLLQYGTQSSNSAQYHEQIESKDNRQHRKEGARYDAVIGGAGDGSGCLHRILQDLGFLGGFLCRPGKLLPALGSCPLLFLRPGVRCRCRSRNLYRSRLADRLKINGCGRGTNAVLRQLLQLLFQLTVLLFQLPGPRHRLTEKDKYDRKAHKEKRNQNNTNTREPVLMPDCPAELSHRILLNQDINAEAKPQNRNKLE